MGKVFAFPTFNMSENVAYFSKRYSRTNLAFLRAFSQIQTFEPLYLAIILLIQYKFYSACLTASFSSLAVPVVVDFCFIKPVLRAWFLVRITYWYKS